MCVSRKSLFARKRCSGRTTTKILFVPILFWLGLGSTCRFFASLGGDSVYIYLANWRIKEVPNNSGSVLGYQSSNKDSLRQYIQENLDIVGRASDLLVSSSPTRTQLLEQYNGTLAQQPLWTCTEPQHSPHKRRLLIFLHVYKTAGSTFRQFLDYYATICGKGIASMNKCADVTPRSLTTGPDTVWVNQADEPCVNVQTRTRGPQVDRKRRPPIRLTDFTYHLYKVRYGVNRIINARGNMTGGLVKRHVDILQGHQPLGLHHYWANGWWSNDDNDNDSEKCNHTTTTTIAVEAQYITFFREPVTRYVSALLFTNRDDESVDDWTFAEAVDAIQQDVRLRLAAGNQNNEFYNVQSSRLSGADEYYDYQYVNAYARYHLTPKQKQRNNMTADEVVAQIQRNLVEYNVMVGIVELMEDSLSVLQSIIDPDLEFTEILGTMAGGRSGFNVAPNAVSTHKVVQALRQDPEFWPLLQKVLQYEFRLYDFALDLHSQQVERMRAMYGTRYSV